MDNNCSSKRYSLKRTNKNINENMPKRRLNFQPNCEKDNTPNKQNACTSDSKTLFCIFNNFDTNLEDSFTCFDDTQTLIKKSDNTYIADSFLPQMCGSTQALIEIGNNICDSISTCTTDSQIPQDINSQFHNLNDEFSLLKENLSILIDNREGLNKKHLGASTSQDNLTAIIKSEIKCEENEITDLFQTSQYKKDVETLFDRVEHSICEPNKNDEEIDFTQSHTLFAESINTIINWNEDSFLTKAVLSPEHRKSFGNVIKKALLENAKKKSSPGKVQNQTLIPNQSSYRELGDFYGLPQKVKDLIKMYKGIENLYDWQDECLNLSAIKEKRNLVYALPTSGGKTLVAEILILQEILCWKRNVIFILPYVAIVQEKVWSLSPFAVALGFLVEEYAAGKGNFPPRKRRRKNSVYIATIEKALGLVNSLIDMGRIEELGLIVIDELHLVGDQTRGSNLEELLSKLLCLKENVQIIGMSATIGNISELCKFLNAEVYTNNFRPVELTEYVKCENELAKINWKAKDESDLFIPEKKYNFSYSEKLNKIDPDCLGGLVMEVIPNDSCLIFCSSKKNCENVAYLLCRVIPAYLKEIKANEKEDLKKSLAQESGNLCNVLKISIPFGVAYHHSGLTSDERRLIEDGFRSGILSVICCTSTLAAGVNLPAKRVILRQPYIGRDFINLSRYKQMVGRAGRTGLRASGESIIICNIQDFPKVKEMLLSPMDEALSALHTNDAVGLRQLLLSYISLNIATTRTDLHKIAKKTLLGVQESRLGVKLSKLTDKAIVELFKLGALKTDDSSNQNTVDSNADVSIRMNSSESLISPSSSNSSEVLTPSKKAKICVSLSNRTKLIISKLGSASIKGGLELKRAHLLYEDLMQAQASLVLLNCLHLLYLVTPYDMSEQVKPSKPRYYKIYTQLGKSELQTARILGLTESTAIRLLNNQPIKSVADRVLNRFYVTLMLYDLWNDSSIFQVAEKFELPRGLVQNLMTSSASFASNVVNFCSELEEFWAFAYLLRGMTERLQHCCVRELLPLMDLPSVKQSRAKQLYNAGYKSLVLIAKANPNDLVECVEYMSRRTANQLIAAAKLLLLERVENLKEEAEDVIDGIEPQLFRQTAIK